MLEFNNSLVLKRNLKLSLFGRRAITGVKKSILLIVSLGSVKYTNVIPGIMYVHKCNVLHKRSNERYD